MSSTINSNNSGSSRSRRTASKSGTSEPLPDKVSLLLLWDNETNSLRAKVHFKASESELDAPTKEAFWRSVGSLKDTFKEISETIRQSPSDQTDRELSLDYSGMKEKIAQACTDMPPLRNEVKLVAQLFDMSTKEQWESEENGTELKVDYGLELPWVGVSVSWREGQPCLDAHVHSMSCASDRASMEEPAEKILKRDGVIGRLRETSCPAFSSNLEKFIYGKTTIDLARRFLADLKRDKKSEAATKDIVKSIGEGMLRGVEHLHPSLKRLNVEVREDWANDLTACKSGWQKVVYNDLGVGGERWA